MEWLNYHHLLYFYVVAKEGSIARASKELRLASPTISGQIHRFQEVLGQELFVRRGRKLVLTDVGQIVFRYAKDIFALGDELRDTLQARTTAGPLRLAIGLADIPSQLLMWRFIEPAWHVGREIHLICRVDKSAEAFIADLSLREVDLVIADAPARQGVSGQLISHLLGECGTTFFAAANLAQQCRRKFPHSLADAPFLLPGAHSALRRTLEAWFVSEKIQPRLIAEFDDSALMKIVAEQGVGVFAAPSVVAADVRRRYRVVPIGRSEAVRQRFYAISITRNINHPAVVAICDQAREDIFG